MWFLLACAEPTEPSPVDLRVSFDALAWSCDDEGEYWVGVEQLFLDVRHAPGQIEPFALPGPGECARWVSPFPDSDGLDGQDLADRQGDLGWSMPLIESFGQPGEGELLQEHAGLWRGDLFNDYNTCHPAEDVLGAEVAFSGSPSLEATALPAPGVLDEVLVNVDIDQGVTIGEEVELSWSAEGWDEQWVGFERRRDGVPVETIVCNTAGQSGFDVDFWDLLELDLPGLSSRLMVGFANREVDHADSVERTSRAIWQVSAHE